MCNHCPYVKAKIDAIKQIYEKFNENIAVVGINSNDSIEYPDDSFENMKKIADEKGIKFDYLVDDKQDVAKRYGAVCTPPWSLTGDRSHTGDAPPRVHPGWRAPLSRCPPALLRTY